MPRIMLIGEWHSGKSTLIRTLSRSDYRPRKVFAVDHHGDFVNTPSEFLENRRWYPALITASAHCDTLIFEAGITLTIPAVSEVTLPETLPPWRREE